MADKVELSLVELIKVERFYAELLMRMKKVVDPKVKSIEVKLDVDGVTLKYNPYFMDQFNPSTDLKNGVGGGASILKHECEHIMRGHLDWRRREVEPDLFKDGNEKSQTIFDFVNTCDTVRLLNMAEDFEINETIPNLPSSFHIYNEKGELELDPAGNPIKCSPCRVEDLQAAFPNQKILKGQTMEYYYDILRKAKEQNQKPNQGKNGSIMMPIDDHGENGDNASGNGQLDPELAKEIAKQLVNEAFEALPSADKGKLPSHIIQLIQSLNEKTKDWRKDLRQFRESCMAIIVEETRRRRNRRYGLLYPGRRMRPKMHLVIAKDTSGSVYDEALTQFDSEILAMSKLGIKITVIDCDAQIQQVYEYKEKFKLVKGNKGRGGTSFAPVFELVKTKEFIKEWGKPDGLIYFTDGEDWGDVKKPNFKVLWALLPNCKSRYDWGSKTYIDVNQKRRRA